MPNFLRQETGELHLWSPHPILPSTIPVLFLAIPAHHQTKYSISTSVHPEQELCLPAATPPERVRTRECALMNMARENPGLLLFVLVSLTSAVSVSSASEAKTLLKFKESLRSKGALSNWNASVLPCKGDGANWSGVLCDNGTVWGLQLENMGLKGNLIVDSLSHLPFLRAVSFMDNNLEGPLPDLTKLPEIKSVYLSNNSFSGEIPARAFDGMHLLKKLYLANNRLSGAIPASLTTLPKLKELMLEGNRFGGEIPDFQRTRLAMANFSNNEFTGPIPESLNYLSASSFSGNNDLCGEPLGLCSVQNISVGTIIVIAIVLAAALAAIVAAVIILRRRNHVAPPPEQNHRQEPASYEAARMKPAGDDLDRMEQGSPENNSSRPKPDQIAKLTFLREGREMFDLPDLLKASAEILGSGVFGSTYKAALTSGKVMVVKRFRQMNNVGKGEFQEHMRRLGRLRHPNLVPLVAFYYRKEEKLLVSDYVDNVSLAVHLHGNNGRQSPILDWPNRLKIIKGIARGLLNLYKELPSLIVPHGHLKSSNVLLDRSNEPLLTDYGLVPLTNLEHAQDLMIAYKSPEYKQQGRITKKTDVWSLGILILEILTGKFPANNLQQGKGSDSELAGWVNSVVREEATGELFDKDMREHSKGNEAEMVKLLKIGLKCCETDVDRRWDVMEAAERIEEVKESDGDEDFYSAHASERDAHSSRGLSDDFYYPTNG